MPLYEYRCQKCGRVIEKIQKFSDAPLTKCEECRGKLEKLLSPPSIHFKGTGWYVTDYARKSSPSSSGSNGGSNGDGSSGKKEKSSEPASTTKK